MKKQNILKKRTSIRKYKAKKISKKQINMLIDAARQAPSSHNTQPWHFIIVNGKTKDKLIKILEKASGNKKEMLFIRMILKPAIEIIKNAPLVILVFSKDQLKEKLSAFTKYFGKSSKQWKNISENVKIWNTQSSSCAVQNILVQAHSMGLGSVWLGITITQKKSIQNLFKTKMDFQGVVTIGYPDEKAKPQKRYPISKMVEYYG